MDQLQCFENVNTELEELIKRHASFFSPAVRAWKSNAERTLIKIYGESSFEVKEFRKTRFGVGVWTTDNECQDAFYNDMLKTRTIFASYLSELKSEEECCDKKQRVSTSEKTHDFSSVFIVHGHNGEIKEGVARLLEKQKIHAIILHEQANNGATIIEKIEHYNKVGAAICLFTADDLGRAKDSQEELRRARQNVVFEAGYFIGKLGRDRVVIISDNHVELPSDLSGVVYTSSNNWQLDLLRELRSIGYQLDFNKL